MSRNRHSAEGRIARRRGRTGRRLSAPDSGPLSRAWPKYREPAEQVSRLKLSAVSLLARLESGALGACVGRQADELSASFPQAPCDVVVPGLVARSDHLFVFDVLPGEGGGVVG
jgi:hypothetical protein